MTQRIIIPLGKGMKPLRIREELVDTYREYVVYEGRDKVSSQAKTSIKLSNGDTIIAEMSVEELDKILGICQ